MNLILSEFSRIIPRFIHVDKHKLNRLDMCVIEMFLSTLKKILEIALYQLQQKNAFECVAKQFHI